MRSQLNKNNLGRFKGKSLQGFSSHLEPVFSKKGGVK